jgi:adenosine deaminase
MLELARERGISLPGGDAGALTDAMIVRRPSSLEAYLERFAITLSLMQDRESLERVAYELAEDHAAENVWYVEVRFCPALCTEGDLTPAEVLEAVLGGLSQATRDFGIVASVIVSALRSRSSEDSFEMADLAATYLARGVSGFDLAGAEAGHPVRDHVASLRAAAHRGVPITIHAGEGFGPASIREAIELGGARRIGHGTRLIEDQQLFAAVREAGIPLEVCLTSNVQTGAVASYERHPLRRYHDEGLRVCLCTDNRLMSGVTLTREYEHARDRQAFTWPELVKVARFGFESAFASVEVRTGLLERFDALVGEVP